MARPDLILEACMWPCQSTGKHGGWACVKVSLEMGRLSAWGWQWVAIARQNKNCRNILCKLHANMGHGNKTKIPRIYGKKN